MAQRSPWRSAAAGLARGDERGGRGARRAPTCSAGAQVAKRLVSSNLYVYRLSLPSRDPHLPAHALRHSIAGLPAPAPPSARLPLFHRSCLASPAQCSPLSALVRAPTPSRQLATARRPPPRRLAFSSARPTSTPPCTPAAHTLAEHTHASRAHPRVSASRGEGEATLARQTFAEAAPLAVKPAAARVTHGSTSSAPPAPRTPARQPPESRRSTAAFTLPPVAIRALRLASVSRKPISHSWLI